MNLNSNSQLSTFTSTENKGLLWSVLHGGGKFDGVPETALKNVQVMFETTINEMNETFKKMNQPVDLNVMNKEAVYVICKKLNAFVVVNPPPPYPVEQKKQQQIPQLETIYRAEDIQKERQSAFNTELKKKEEEMSSIIKLRKPDEIKFTDDNYDKPIGDDMERLLAETLASRERELEQITKSKEDKDIAEKWINPNSIAPAKNQNSTNNDADRKKKVSFNHIQIEHEHVHEHEDNFSAPAAPAVPPPPPSNENTTLEINTLFNKFKKITTPTNNQNNNNLMIQMSEDIAFIKKSMIELMRSMSLEPK
jgi:hypothetical protein